MKWMSACTALALGLLGSAAQAQAGHGHGGGHPGGPRLGGPTERFAPGRVARPAPGWHSGAPGYRGSPGFYRGGPGARPIYYSHLPRGAVGVPYGRGHYYYGGGHWYRPWGARFVIAAPPIGFVAPFLPLGYATYWYGGLPYYYADGAYYTGASGGYQVVAPPAQVVANATPAPPPVPAPAPAPDPIFYPSNGQSADQLLADKQECNRWATTQPSALDDAAVFQRATFACMEGRGYTVQ